MLIPSYLTLLKLAAVDLVVTVGAHLFDAAAWAEPFARAGIAREVSALYPTRCAECDRELNARDVCAITRTHSQLTLRCAHCDRTPEACIAASVTARRARDARAVALAQAALREHGGVTWPEVVS